MLPPVAIRPLADRPEAIPMLARQFYDEWHSYDGRSIPGIEAQLRENLSRDSTPITFIAEIEKEIVGTVSLDVSETPPQDRRWPWIGSLYVRPAFRCQGIGSLLMRHAQEFALRLKLEPLYLWTADATSFYEKCGWKPLRRVTHRSREFTLLQFAAASKP